MPFLHCSKATQKCLKMKMECLCVWKILLASNIFITSGYETWQTSKAITKEAICWTYHDRAQSFVFSIPWYGWIIYDNISNGLLQKGSWSVVWTKLKSNCCCARSRQWRIQGGGGGDLTERYWNNRRQNRLSDNSVPFHNFKLGG